MTEPDRMYRLMGPMIDNPTGTRSGWQQVTGLRTALEGWFEQFTEYQLVAMAHSPYLAASNEFLHFAERCYLMYLLSVAETLEQERQQ